MTLKKDLAHFYKNVSRWREDEKVKIALACTWDPKKQFLRSAQKKLLPEVFFCNAGIFDSFKGPGAPCFEKKKNS